jgi:hypothetical protein
VFLISIRNLFFRDIPMLEIEETHGPDTNTIIKSLRGFSQLHITENMRLWTFFATNLPLHHLPCSYAAKNKQKLLINHFVQMERDLESIHKGSVKSHEDNQYPWLFLIINSTHLVGSINISCLKNLWNFIF